MRKEAYCQEKQENFIGLDRVEYKPHVRSVSFQKIEETPNINIIYFGGTFEMANAKSTKELKQSLADYSGKTLFSFTASTDTKKAANFIEDIQGDKILVGYSQGANKILDLNKELRERKNNSVQGLIFLEPTSLHEQKNLAWTFLKQGFKTTKGILKQELGISPSIKREREKMVFKKGRILLGEILSDGIPKVFGFKCEYSLREQIKDMSRIHPEIEKVESPVVIIQGKDDRITDHTKNGPEIFKTSKQVTRILAKRHGAHALPIMRSEQVAKVALWQLLRKK